MLHEDRLRAWIRIGLGTAQIMGATMLVYLYTVDGPTALSGTVGAVTLACVIVSRAMFAKSDRDAVRQKPQKLDL